MHVHMEDHMRTYEINNHIRIELEAFRYRRGLVSLSPSLYYMYYVHVLD